MFPAQQRLSRPEFTTYFATGARHHHAYCTFVYTTAASTKVAVVVGKKVSKKAPVRNRLRRRVYAAARRYLDNHSPAATGVYIIILKPAALGATRAELATVVTEMFAKINNSR